MNKNILYVLSILVGGLLASCDADKVDGVDFDVTVRNNVEEIYAGDEVTFDFTGDPNYVIFYSGEAGNQYAYSNRLRVDEIESMKLSCTILQQYTQVFFRDRETLQVYVSTDFSGEYTPAGIAGATWMKISGAGEAGKLKVPICHGTGSETVSSEVDLSAYKEQEFYLAFQYYVPLCLDVLNAMPRIDVVPLSLDRQVAGEKISNFDPALELGFRFTATKGDLNAKYGLVDNSRLLFQPGVTGIELETWAISKKIDPFITVPDQGTPIKSLDMMFPSYKHRYENPGEYTVTFVARNANAWNTESVVKEIKIIVKAK